MFQKFFVFMLSIFFIAVGLIFIIGSWGAYYTDTKIVSDNITASGTIINKSFVYSADGDSEYIVKYIFNDFRGDEVKGSYAVSKKKWTSVNKGEKIDILYSYNNSRRNFPIGYGVVSLGITIFSCIMGSIAFLVGILVFISTFKSKTSLDNID